MPLNYILDKSPGEGATNLQNRKKRLITLCTWGTTSNCLLKEKELDSLIQRIRIYSQDIEMKRGIEKCAVFIIKKWEKTNNRRNRTTKSKMLRKKETFKYLGILEVDTIKKAAMKEKNKRLS